MLDIVVIILYALGMLALGWLGLHKAKSREGYLVAGRRLGPGMYVGTLSAVILGGASTVGTIRIGYVYGISGVWLCGALGIGIIVLSLFLTGPLTQFKLYTVTELFERRYNRSARKAGALVMLAYDVMIAVTSTIAIGTLAETALHVPAPLAIVLGGVLVLAYSAMGGMWSLTLTDIVQFIIMTIGILILMLPVTIHQAGGWDTVVARAHPGAFSPTAIGSGTIVTYFVIYGLGVLIGQDVWQRVFTARSVKVARIAGGLAGVYCILYGIVGALIGVVASVMVPGLDDPDQAFVQLLEVAVPSGLRGLLMAAALAAMMSTSSSALLAASTLVSQDLLGATRFNRHRLWTIIMGGVVTLLSLMITDVMSALTVAYDLLVGGMLVPLLATLFFPRTRTLAAVAGMAAGILLVVVFMLKDGLAANSPVYAGLVANAVVMLGVSLCCRPQPTAQN